MYPTFYLLGREIGAYAALSLIGVLVAGLTIYILNRNSTIRKDQLLHLFLISIAGLFIGAHFLYGITQLPHIIDVLINKRDSLSTIEDVYYLFAHGFGGMVFYGGLIGGLLAGYLYCGKLYLNTHEYMNALAPAIPLFHAFGRIGCFLSGCCYGIESEFGFIYTHSLVEEANHVQRFPVQLLEVFLELILFIVLSFLLIKYRNRFSLIRIYLFSYGMIRFFDEFLRGDLLRGMWGPFSTSQWISLLIIIVLIVEYIIKRNKKISKS